MPTTTFEAELVRAAKARLGMPAIYHQSFAGNCFEQPTAACMEAGMGPDEFDCSGLVINAFCDVMGVEPERWPARLRHVRDMWREATDSGVLFREAPEATVGSLLVVSRRYNLEGRPQKVAGHIGFVADQTGVPGFQTVRFLHASPTLGSVAEATVSHLDSHLGIIVPTEAFYANGPDC